MAKNNNPQSPNSDERQKLGELERLERDVERRLAALEGSVSEIRKSHLDGHKWFVTIFFGLVGIFLTYTANQSKNDVREDLRDVHTQIRDSITDMRQQVDEATAQQQATVDKAVAQMNQNFRNLAGDALKQPMLVISNDVGLLDGQTLTLKNGQFTPFPLYVTNIGDKKSDELSLQIYAARDLGLSGWGPVVPTYDNNKEYPFCYKVSLSDARAGISPHETKPIVPDPNLGAFNGFSPTLLPVDCKILIFYGGEQPAEANLKIKIQ